MLPCWTSIPLNLTSYCLALFLGDCLCFSCTEPTSKPTQDSFLKRRQRQGALHHRPKPLKLLQTIRKVKHFESSGHLAQAHQHTTAATRTHPEIQQSAAPLATAACLDPAQASPVWSCIEPSRHNCNEPNLFLAKNPQSPIHNHLAFCCL